MRTKYLSPSELSLLHSVLARFRSTNVREVLLFDILLATGARSSELLNVTVSDLNPHDQTIFFRGLKGSRDRAIPVTPDLFKRLSAYTASMHPTERVFKLSYTRLQALWSLYRPIRKPLHCLRHTFAITLYKRHKDLYLVQRALGHRSITSTMVYQDYVYGLDEMRKVLPVD